MRRFAEGKDIVYPRDDFSTGCSRNRARHRKFILHVTRRVHACNTVIRRSTARA